MLSIPEAFGRGQLKAPGEKQAPLEPQWPPQRATTELLQSRSLRRAEPEAGRLGPESTAWEDCAGPGAPAGGARRCRERCWGCKAVQSPGRRIRQRGAGRGAGHCTGRCIGRCTGGAGLWTLHWGCSALGGARGGAGRRAVDSVIRREQRARSASAATASRCAQRVPELRLETCRSEPALPR